MSKLENLSAAVDNFLNKASKKNEPLEAFRDTDDFKSFENSMSTGILDQVKAMANKLPKWMIDDEEFDEKRVTKWVEDNQKTIAKYVEQKDIYKILIAAFTYSVESFYQRQGIKLKKAADPSVTFELTNQYYLDALNDQANYLLNKSSIDETTRNRMINLIRDTRTNMVTIDELAEIIVSEFEGISDTRAFQIANTEANQAMSSAQQAFLEENGIATKVWVAAGPNTCPICEGNADQGPIPVNDDFDSGDPYPPGHPGCECYEDAGELLDLDSIDVLWDGGDTDFSRSYISDKEQKALQKKQQQNMIDEILKTKEAVKTEVQSIRSDLKSIANDRLDSKKALQEAVADLSNKITPEHKTIIQKADLPPELIQVINLLTEVATAPDSPQPVLLSEYKPHDEEEGDIDYFGYLHQSGAWYIVRGEDDRQRYCAGLEKYKEAWANKENLAYDYISEAFK